jgi:hypothetical protein
MSNDPEPPVSINVPLAALINLGLEHWRLAGAIGPSPTAPARHALRRIGDFLSLCELDVRVLDGHAFDPGLAACVIDTIDDPALAADVVVIHETLSPMVLWRGRVVKAADVVTRQGTLTR